MIEVQQLIARVKGEHRLALEWFNTKRGQRVTWNEIKAHTEVGARLVAQAKGIYKPQHTDYALSVRTLQEGPYPDKEVEFRPDGSWVVEYFQEDPNPDNRDRRFTNRGLMKCMEDQIPVGFLVKRKPKPGVQYDVLGLGLVTGWREGYFTIEGFSDGGVKTDNGRAADAAKARAHAVNLVVSDEDFDVNAADIDLRERTIKHVACRRGQQTFRATLLEAYAGRCCITGCDLTDVLEAAHISPYRGPQSNHPQNGLLLRADIHTLFDLGLLAVDDDYRLLLSDKVGDSTTYWDFASRRLELPPADMLKPDRAALRQHREWSGFG